MATSNVKFDRFIFVDWSASATPTKGANSIWIGSCTRDTMGTVDVVNSLTRKEALSHLEKMITSNRNEKTLLGFDFGFGYPYQAYQTNTADEDWEVLWKKLHNEILCEKCGNEKENRFAWAEKWNKDHGLYFWGKPVGKIYDDKYKNLPRTKPENIKEFRITEKRAVQSCIAKGSIKSQWQLFSGVTVGSQTLLGIPYVYELRRYLEKNNMEAKVWPFETDFAKDFEGQVLICETHFGIVKKEVDEMIRKSSAVIKDEAQVEQMCRLFAEKSEDDINKLLKFKWNNFKEDEKDKITKKEGWILGVPLHTKSD